MGARILGCVILAAAALGLAVSGTDAGTSAPNRCAVVYDTGGGYQMVYPDGTGRRTVRWLPHGNLRIDWTRDGARVATVDLRRDGDYELNIVDRSGRRVRTIETSGRVVDGVRWSPDGRRLAFVAGDYDGGHLYVVGRDGRGPRNLTAAAGPARISMAAPSWSPDGRRLVFTGRVGKGRPSVYTLGVDGKRLRQVRLPFGQVDAPDWSPDGKRLAFTVSGANEGITVANVDGTGARRLTSSEYDSNPLWSPDGAYLAFSHSQDPPSDVYVVRVADGRVRRLTTSPYHYYDPGQTAAGWYCGRP